jgi:hypothetical protein
MVAKIRAYQKIKPAVWGAVIAAVGTGRRFPEAPEFGRGHRERDKVRQNDVTFIYPTGIQHDA